jgi:DNA-binding HxlR family transcriptional regulator
MAMSARRSYGDPCGIARALDLVGDRWALLTVRELVLGPKRFSDLRTGLPHLSPDVLSQRLRELEGVGVVCRTKLPPPASSRVYELTEWGRELEPAILALGRWGSRAPFPPDPIQLGIDAFVLALRTLFDPAAAAGLTASVELRFGEHHFRTVVGDGRLRIAPGRADDPDAIVETTPGALTAVLWHGRRRDDAERLGELTITGSRHVVDRFLTLFPAPKPAGLG